MNYWKVFAFIVRLCVGIVLILLIWKPFVHVVFVMFQAPDARCDLGDGYEMWGPPPWGIIYWPSIENKDEAGFQRVIDNPVNEFALIGPWVIGKTPKGFFAIQKELHNVHYPISKKNIETITGIDLSSINMETNPMPYLIVRPKALEAKAKANLFCWILLFVVPLIFGFAPYVPKALRAKRNNGKR